jgi:hypothetical protein
VIKNNYQKFYQNLNIELNNKFPQMKPIHKYLEIDSQVHHLEKGNKVKEKMM